MRIIVKTAKQIEAIRKACQVTSRILDEVSTVIQPGITTEVINSFVHERTLELGATPAPLNYKGFPKSVCVSINEVVCHGIPSEFVVLNEGDVVNVDVTSIVDGYYGDSSRMYFVGGDAACKKAAVDLVNDTYKSLYAGIKEVAPGKNFGDIGAGIQKYIEGLDKNYGIVREYTGHGIGCDFHESPQILHVGRYGTGPKMKPGMIFTIEPMINLGTYKTVLSSLDGWTVRTADGKLSAQWEHTVLVTPGGYEILTLAKDESAH